MKTLEAGSKYEGIVIKIQNNAGYVSKFEEHLGKAVIAVGSKLITSDDKTKKFSFHTEIFFVEDTNDGKKYYFGTLHDLMCLNNDKSKLPKYYKDVSVDYYNLEEMNTVFIVRNLVEISGIEFKALVGKYFIYGRVDKENRPENINMEEFIKSRANRMYLTGR